VCLDTSIRLADDFEEPLEAALALANEWGAPLVRVFGGPFDADDVAARIGGILSDATVTVALETHDDASSSAVVAHLLDAVGTPLLAALWDVHHPFRVGEAPGDVIANLGDRIALVHVKDAVRRGDDWELVLLGEGEVPVRESLVAAHAAGYDGWVSVEWEKRWHPELAEPELALPQHAALLRRWFES
jgi:fatty-acyl-CoA synthase